MEFFTMPTTIGGFGALFLAFLATLGFGILALLALSSSRRRPPRETRTEHATEQRLDKLPRLHTCIGCEAALMSTVEQARAKGWLVGFSVQRCPQCSA